MTMIVMMMSLQWAHGRKRQFRCCITFPAYKTCFLLTLNQTPLCLPSTLPPHLRVLLQLPPPEQKEGLLVSVRWAEDRLLVVFLLLTSFAEKHKVPVTFGKRPYSSNIIKTTTTIWWVLFIPTECCSPQHTNWESVVLISHHLSSYCYPDLLFTKLYLISAQNTYYFEFGHTTTYFY